MDDAYARCTAILEQYRPQLVEVAEYLLANETMTAEEFGEGIPDGVRR